MKENSLGKKERIKGVSQTKALFHCPSVITCFPFKLFFKYTDVNAYGTLQFGVAIPKKRFKRAVDRNRLKRQVRELYRKKKKILGRDIKRMDVSMMFVYTGDILLPMKQLEKSMDKVLKELKNKIAV